MQATPDDCLWTLIGKLERILIKLYKQNLSLLFNQHA